MVTRKTMPTSILGSDSRRDRMPLRRALREDGDCVDPSSSPSNMSLDARERQNSISNKNIIRRTIDREAHEAIVAVLALPIVRVS
mmetsp:Transcript_25480/g.61255  ORF Transcript_25480/g.61255 Transcript_25480/m.61255 type:complete len:85 (+) Transcript_25480:2113-2367(+)